MVSCSVMLGVYCLIVEANLLKAPTVITFLSDIFPVEGTLAKVFTDNALPFNNRVLHICNTVGICPHDVLTPALSLNGASVISSEPSEIH